jgi:hypothetical protein
MPVITVDSITCAIRSWRRRSWAATRSSPLQALRGQLEKADPQEFPRIVDSARIPNPRRNTKTLVGKPHLVEIAVAEALFEASDQNRAERLSSFVARDSFSPAAAERQRRSRCPSATLSPGVSPVNLGRLGTILLRSL